MNPQQAGVSADEVRKQFEAWWLARHPGSQFNDLKRTAKSGAYDKEWLNDCWLAWKEALATAPPEQAARRYAEAWIVLQNGRVHSVHATREHANLENGEHLIMPETPWAILGSEQATTVANIQMSTTEQGSFDSVNTQPQAVSAGALTFEEFSRINRQRCESKEGFNHSLSSWSTSDWFTALMGELGEAANIAKKLNRVRDGIPGNKSSKEELQAKLRQELGDVFVYLDLLAQSEGFFIGNAATEVFNAKSQELNCPILITALAAHDQKVRAEPLAAWMIANSFATGHGDTVEDLLKELKWQIKERTQKVRAEVLETAAQEVEKLNELWPVTCMDQPYRDAAQAIRSLAAPAPAASKPEADKEGAE